MQANRIETDCLIIGAGPVGLFSVFELGLLDIKCDIIDILDKPGGQCAELYPDKPIYDIPGIPEITGEGLVSSLIKQIEPFNPVFHLSRIVTELKKVDDRWEVKTDFGDTFSTKVIVIAAGGGSFQPKKPPIKDIEDYEDFSVFYSIRDKDKFKDKDIVIAGGGDSALDWVLDLHTSAKSLTLVHRRKEFRAVPDTVNKVQELIEAGKINFELGQINQLSGENNKLEGISIKNGDQIKDINCQILLPFFGLTMKLGPVADWGLNLNENLIEVDTEKFETNQDAIFAIGDINTYPGKLKLILSGFHEGALAARACFKLARPNEKYRFEFTTSSKAIKNRLGVKSD